MKIKLYFLCMLIVAARMVNAQSYHPFPSSNTIWAEYFSPHADSNFRIVYYGLKDRDTVINSQTYHRLYRSADTLFQETEFIGGLRNDTAERKVYIYGPLTYGPGSVETLFYDFSLNQGDTLKRNANGGRNNWYINNNMTVTAVDSIIIDGTWRKRMFLDFPIPTIWVEGMGNMVRGLAWFTGDYPTNGTWNELLCMKQHGDWIYHHATGWRNSTLIIPTCDSLQNLNVKPQDIKSISAADGGIRFFPNPLTGVSRLTIKETGRYELLELYNMTGSRVLSVSLDNKKEIAFDRKDFVPGFYVYRLKAKGEIYVSGRFTVE